VKGLARKNSRSLAVIRPREGVAADEHEPTHQLRTGSRRLAPQPEPVAPREPHVGHHGVERLQVDGVQSFHAVLGGDDFTALLLESQAQRGTHEFFVLDHEDSQFGRFGHGCRGFRAH